MLRFLKNLKPKYDQTYCTPVGLLLTDIQGASQVTTTKNLENPRPNTPQITAVPNDYCTRTFVLLHRCKILEGPFPGCE